MTLLLGHEEGNELHDVVKDGLYAGDPEPMDMLGTLSYWPGVTDFEDRKHVTLCL